MMMPYIKMANPIKQSRMPTLQGTNISPKNGMFEDDFPIPQVGYVNSLEGIYIYNPM